MSERKLPDGNYGPNGLSKPAEPKGMTYPTYVEYPKPVPHETIDNDVYRKQVNRERHSSYKK